MIVDIKEMPRWFVRMLFIMFVMTVLNLKPVHANIIGNDTQNFNPIPSGIDFTSVHSSETLKEGIFNSSFIINRARNTLPTTRDAFGIEVVTCREFCYHLQC
jgi:hypothetical protein